MSSRGTKFARTFRGVLLWMAAAPTFAGCIVTDEADVQSPGNTPPMIVVGSASPPLEEVIVVDKQEDPDPTAGSRTFKVQIREPDREDTIQWLMYVDRREDGAVADGKLSPTPNRDVRLLEASVARSDFTTAGCHRVELRVSSLFSFSPRWLPQEEGDIDTAVWWVFTKTTSTPRPDPAGCPPAE